LRGLDKDASRKIAEKRESTILESRVGTSQAGKSIRAGSTKRRARGRTHALQKAGPTLIDAVIELIKEMGSSIN
jgi:hypothetical protein